MKTTKALTYPRLQDQPSYREALNKLSHFRSQLQVEQQKLHQLHIEHARSVNPDEKRDPEAEHIIQKAEALISGTAPLQSLADQIQTKSRLIAALEAASKVQGDIVRDVERELSREAGLHFATEHKAVVTRLLAAVEELHQSNLAEVDFRNELERMGYYGALRAMQFDQLEELDPTTRGVGRAHYWARDAKAYIA